MKTKIFTITLLLALVYGSAYAQRVWIGGIEMYDGDVLTPQNCSVVKRGSVARTGKTVTLDNALVEATGSHNALGCSDYDYGIYLEFNGNCVLQAEADAIRINGKGEGNQYDQCSVHIYALNSKPETRLTIRSTANAGVYLVSEEYYYDLEYIHSYTGLFIETGRVNIYGKTYGIFSKYRQKSHFYVNTNVAYVHFASEVTNRTIGRTWVDVSIGNETYSLNDRKDAIIYPFDKDNFKIDQYGNLLYNGEVYTGKLVLGKWISSYESKPMGLYPGQSDTIRYTTTPEFGFDDFVWQPEIPSMLSFNTDNYMVKAGSTPGETKLVGTNPYSATKIEIPVTVIRDYGIKLNGIEVNSFNRKDILGDGTATYNPRTRTLRLNNANINMSGDYALDIRSEVGRDMTIECVSNKSSLTSTSYAAIRTAVPLNITRENDGELTVSGPNGGIVGKAGNETLVIIETKINAQANYAAINNFKDIILSKADITYPLGALFSSTTKSISLNGTHCPKVKIGFEYDLYVGGTQVMITNRENILNDIQKTVVYNHLTNTLYLKDANITSHLKDGNNLYGIRAGNGINISLTGNSTINPNPPTNMTNLNEYGIAVKGNLNIKGDGTLAIKTQGRAGTTHNYAVSAHKQDSFTDFGGDITIENSTLNINSYEYGLYANNINLNNKSEAEISTPTMIGRAIRYGNSISIYPAGEFRQGESKNEAQKVDAITFENKQSKPYVYIIKPRYYPLWVAGEQVTSFNASAITGEGITGSVSYDPATKTLTLNNAELKELSHVTDSEWGEHNSIFANQDLNIILIGNNTIDDTGLPADKSYAAICNWNKDWTQSFKLNISGQGTLTINAVSNKYTNGICAPKITINGTTVKVTTRSTCLYSIRDLNIENNANIELFSIDFSGITQEYGPLSIYSGAVIKAGKDKNSTIDISNPNDLMSEDSNYILIRPTGTGLPSITSQGIKVTGGKGVIEISPRTQGDFAERMANIYNVSGALVRTLPLQNSEGHVSVPAGIYIVKIGNAAEKVMVW